MTKKEAAIAENIIEITWEMRRHYERSEVQDLFTYEELKEFIVELANKFEKGYNDYDNKCDYYDQIEMFVKREVDERLRQEQ